MHTEILALVGLANLASTHMIMSNPVPFNKASLNSSPLSDAGADFPCKFGGSYGPSPSDVSNVYAQGSKQKLEFIGQATHGGGSCQVSLTTDLKPTKSSVWKVIKSIQGGCVAKNTAGNMGNDAKAKDPFTYDFTIPKELASGNYTLAWTWFNRIGNREMYMNCAPLTVTGSGGSQTFLNGLPDMFVANTGNGCRTKESVDVMFPDPGKDVDNFGGSAMSSSGGTTEGNCKSGAGAAGSANGGASQPPSYPATQPDSAQNPKASAPAGDLSQPSGVSVPSSPPTEPIQTQAAVMSGNTSKPIPGGSSSPSGGFGAGTACSGDTWNCIGGTSFQRCVNGAWSAAQPVAAGTSCSPGQANELKTAKRRSLSRAIRFSA